jgi:hypothetical protein
MLRCIQGIMLTGPIEEEEEEKKNRFNPLPPNDMSIYIYICRTRNDIYMLYRTANLQMLHFKYLFNKYPY